MIGTSLGHYRILAKLGHGGMGEVYRAEDTKLKREVALKVLPGDIAGDVEALARFQREAESVAKLNHPNIVTIYSVEEDGGVHFLTMELVAGKSLDRLIPEGGLGLERIFDLAIPFADALSAAHDRGILHRDLKPANIMVTEEGRVKILDFGLAKLLDEPEAGGGDEATQALTQAGRVMGTFPYMSPEQVQGKPLDQRSDIFSMGVILHEMACGRRPFAGDTSAELISSILRDQPEPVSDLKAELPYHLGRIVRHCLEKDPKRRYQSALDVRNELEGLRKEVESGAVHSETAVLDRLPESRWRALPRWVPVAGLVVVLLLAAGLGWRFLAPGKEARSTAAGPADAAVATDRSSIAVLYFDNLSGDPELDWLRNGLTDMLVTDLSQSPDLRVLSTDRLFQILSDLRKLDERITSFEVVRDVADRAQVATVILGSFVKLGETIRISIKVQEAATGEILEARSVDARVAEEIFARIDDLSRSVRRAVELPERTVVASDRNLEDVSTSSVVAYRYYVEAEKLHYQTREQEAIELYKKAVEEDPSFAMAWAKLATGHNNLSMPEQSREYAEKAMEHLDRLTEPERAYVEGRYYGQTLDTWPQAIDTYSKTLARYPHQTALANNLGILYNSLWMLDKAIATFEKGIAHGDVFPGTHHTLAETYLGKGDTRRAFEILNAFVERNPGSFSTWSQIAMLHMDLGEFDAAEAALGRAEELRPDWIGSLFSNYHLAVLREDWQAAEGWIGRIGELPFPFARSAEKGLMANQLLYHGRSSEALARIDEAIAAWPGSGSGRAQGRLQAAGTHLLLERPHVALEHARAARELDRGGIVDYIGHALEAVAQQLLGQERRADLLAAELGRRVEAIGGPALNMLVHETRGRIAQARGDEAAAIEELGQALDLIPVHEQNGPRVRFALGEVYRDAGRSRDAERLFREIVDAARSRTFQPVEFVRSHYELAQLLERRGERDEAGRLYRTFLDYWGDGDLDRDRVAYARRYLSGSPAG